MRRGWFFFAFLAFGTTIYVIGFVRMVSSPIIRAEIRQHLEAFVGTRKMEEPMASFDGTGSKEDTLDACRSSNTLTKEPRARTDTERLDFLQTLDAHEIADLWASSAATYTRAAIDAAMDREARR